MGAWLKDLTHARRRFSKSPSFVAAVVISIGLASPPTPPSFRWSAGSSCARPRRRSHYAPIPADDRTFLADLHRLVGNQHRSFFRAQNKLYVVKLAGPEVAVGVAHRPSQVNRAASVLHGVIKKLHMSDAGCLLAIRGQPHRRFQPCRPPSAIEPQADHEQKLAFFQVLAILEMALDNPAPLAVSL